VLHVSYTARSGGDLLRTQVEGELAEALNASKLASGEQGLVRRISLRHEAPTAWARFLQTPNGTRNEITLPIERGMLPLFVGDRPVEIRSVLVLPRIARAYLDDYGDTLAGAFRPLGESDTNTARQSTEKVRSKGREKLTRRA
jgi:hypothetical protein